MPEVSSEHKACINMSNHLKARMSMSDDLKARISISARPDLKARMNMSEVPGERKARINMSFWSITDRPKRIMCPENRKETNIEKNTMKL